MLLKNNYELNKKLSKKLVMTLLVRDEQEIVEECIKFHLSQGVDFIIATDNGSLDDTRNILLKYQAKGVLELIDEPEHSYNQDVWVHRMIMIAKRKYKADWIINVDADEFWFSNYGNIKLSLPDPKRFNVAFVNALQVSPVDCGEVFAIPESVSGVVSASWKCLHTAKGYRKITMGNHSVMMKKFYRKYSTTIDIVVFHFAIRSYKHYEKKVLMTINAFNNNPRFDKNVGAHIRKSYELYKQGKLLEEYELLKIKYINEPNYIKKDSRLYDFIKNNYKSIESVAAFKYGVFNSKITMKPNKGKLQKFYSSCLKRFTKIYNYFL
jgi:hypothetical protein